MTRTSAAPQPPASAHTPTSDSFDHGRFAPGTLIGDRYRIVARLGVGGMGEVYRADDLTLGQAVALKLDNASLSAGLAPVGLRLAR